MQGEGKFPAVQIEQGSRMQRMMFSVQQKFSAAFLCVEKHTAV
jgi:hypothetical protein